MRDLILRTAGAVAALLLSTAAHASPALVNNTCTISPNYIESSGDLGDTLGTTTPLVAASDTFVICGMLGDSFGGDTEDYALITNFTDTLVRIVLKTQVNYQDGSYGTIDTTTETRLLTAAMPLSISFTSSQAERNLFYSFVVTQVPLPASALLLMGGLAALGGIGRRGRRAA